MSMISWLRYSVEPSFPTQARSRRRPQRGKDIPFPNEPTTASFLLTNIPMELSLWEPYKRGSVLFMMNPSAFFVRLSVSAEDFVFCSTVEILIFWSCMTIISSHLLLWCRTLALFTHSGSFFTRATFAFRSGR